MDTLLCFLHESTAKELGVQITATYTGTLRVGEVRQSPFVLGLTLPRFGFGYLGSFGAELVYVSVSDLVIQVLSEKTVSAQGCQNAASEQ
jgi:hypothetical protein